MIANHVSEIETIIKEFLEFQEKSLAFTRKRNDAEKEYNKFLTTFNGGIRNYTLNQAEQVYKAYRDMQEFEIKSKEAEERFLEAEDKLKEIGHILFDATINAEISVPSSNGGGPALKSITVTFNEGQVRVA